MRARLKSFLIFKTSSNFVSGAIMGIVKRPDCSAASLAILLQRSGLSALAIDRSDRVGMIWLTPNSVHFWMIKSIFLALGRHWAIVICVLSSVFGVLCSMMLQTTLSLPIFSIVAK